MVETVLDLPLDARPDPDEFVRAAMDWHFNPETGSAYWLQKAKTLGFDPRTDVKSVEDLALFPHLINELCDVRAENLIPRGYGANPDIVGVYDSGGTTGALGQKLLAAGKDAEAEAYAEHVLCQKLIRGFDQDFSDRIRLRAGTR